MGHHDTVSYRLRAAGAHFQDGLTALDCDAAAFSVRSGKLSHFLGNLIVTVSKAATGKQARVAIFGDCVHLLWAQGNAEAAIQFEKLGNELAKTYDVDILCGYSLRSVQGGMDSQIFQRTYEENLAVDRRSAGHSRGDEAVSQKGFVYSRNEVHRHARFCDVALCSFSDARQHEVWLLVHRQEGARGAHGQPQSRRVFALLCPIRSRLAQVAVLQDHFHYKQCPLLQSLASTEITLVQARDHGHQRRAPSALPKMAFSLVTFTSSNVRTKTILSTQQCLERRFKLECQVAFRFKRVSLLHVR
jgi:hypothetical protein